MTPNWCWTLQGQITLYMYNNCPWFPNFTPFRSMTSRFWDTGHTCKWDKCTEWPKITLNTTRPYVPYMYVTSIHESQISLNFALRRSIFEIMAILRQVHRMTSNWPWTPQGQITLYVYNNCPCVSDFIPFRSTANLFELQVILRQVHRITPKWHWTLQGQRYTTYMLLMSLSPKCHFVLPYDQPFSWYRTFYNSKLTTMFNVQNKNKKKLPKIQNMKFHNSWYNFGRDMNCWEQICCALSEEMSFEVFFSHMVPC